ncbi:MAG: NfeD family protein [Spirochaetaceae bacterium]|nr:NfeD family protein [Spirochaetaceae bacterium]
MDMMSFITLPWFWLILTAVFTIIELASSLCLTTIWFAISAFLMTFLSMFVKQLHAQLAIFVVIAVVLLVLTRPFVIKRLNAGKEKTNVDSLIGKKALTLDAISEFESGSVKLNGVVWTAKSWDGSFIGAGEKCVVTAVEGAHVIVRREICFT